LRNYSSQTKKEKKKKKKKKKKTAQHFIRSADNNSRGSYKMLMRFFCSYFDDNKKLFEKSNREGELLS